MIWLILIPAILIVVWITFIAPRLPVRSPGKLKDYSYAHRGLWNRDVPENSLPAFQNAVSKGFGIELDVQLTADGKLAVFHDENMQRMCGFNRDIRQCTWSELNTCRLVNTDEKIPTFEEALSTVNGSVPLIIELKTCSRRYDLCEKVRNAMEGYAGIWCIESFDPLIVRWWRLHSPQTIRGVLVMGLEGHPENMKKPMFWFLASLMQNCLARPDFIACEASSGRNLPMWMMKNVFRPTLAAWTVRSQQQMNELQ